VRAWFATEAEASKEADLRNQEMGKGSPLSAKNGGKLSNADILSPSTVTEAAVIKMGNTPTDDELLELIETMGSPMETAREILNLRAENSRLQQENSRLRNDHGSDAEIFAMLTADHPSERYEDQINW
jgi:hypothetical protein